MLAICEPCKGRGKTVRTNPPKGNNPYMTEEVVPCSGCGGTGKIEVPDVDPADVDLPKEGDELRKPEKTGKLRKG
jgi:hypothetical protein